MNAKERMDLWVDHLVEELPDTFSDLCVPEDERPNMAEICVGMVRAAVRLVMMHAPMKEAPEALQMLTSFMGNEVQACAEQSEVKENPETIALQ